ncbi:hypothetical protein C1H46_045260 [Malus baccata]|uniref:Uncharacterized protein n=1 Tax=Malus baccata TaxID=106549 RepID=A0A540K4S5_MALBA|nr:hypothetical protein C1H46_045260 [Malus baccata]
MRSLAPPKSLPSSFYLPFSSAPLLERIVNHLIKEPAAGMVYKEAYATINQLWL